MILKVYLLSSNMWILNAEWSCKQILNGPQMGPLLQIKKLLEIGTSPFYYKDIFYYKFPNAKGKINFGNLNIFFDQIISNTKIFVRLHLFVFVCNANKYFLPFSYLRKRQLINGPLSVHGLLNPLSLNWLIFGADIVL